MKLNGILDLIPFLNYLKVNSVWYQIYHLRDDSVMVSYTLVGKRVELDFFIDHIEYSVFTGNEDVETDIEPIFADILDFIT